MAGVNSVVVSGRLTSDAVEVEGTTGFKCFFHMHVHAGNQTKLWLCVHFAGKKAERLFDDLDERTLATVEGALGCRDGEQSGPIHIVARNVTCEAYDGRSLP